MLRMLQLSLLGFLVFCLQCAPLLAQDGAGNATVAPTAVITARTELDKAFKDCMTTLLNTHVALRGLGSDPKLQYSDAGRQALIDAQYVLATALGDALVNQPELFYPAQRLLIGLIQAHPSLPSQFNVSKLAQMLLNKMLLYGCLHQMAQLYTVVEAIALETADSKATAALDQIVAITVALARMHRVGNEWDESQWVNASHDVVIALQALQLPTMNIQDGSETAILATIANAFFAQAPTRIRHVLNILAITERHLERALPPNSSDHAVAQLRAARLNGNPIRLDRVALENPAADAAFWRGYNTMGLPVADSVQHLIATSPFRIDISPTLMEIAPVVSAVRLPSFH